MRNTGTFKVCYILERREDKTNYLGHKVEADNPCDGAFMEDISS